MHYWGDEWFEKNGKDLYDAINFIEDYLRKHHIGVCGKEKYGTYRDEYLRLWNGGIYSILFGHRGYVGTYHRYKCEWFKDIVNKIHHFIYFVIDEGHTINQREGESFEDYSKRYSNRKWKGLTHFNYKIGLTGFVQKIQAKYYNYAFQIACKKWPNIIDELIVDVEGYKMIKPCKYGNIDGEEIHKKYWIPIDQIEKSEKNGQK